MNTALVVEDCLVDQKAIAFSLHESGFNVLTAQNEEEAKEQISSNQPDIIILDILLPGRSGFEICREFKTDPKTTNIPVVFCSSKGSELDKFWGLKQGAAAYLIKPFKPEEFIPIIKQLISSKA